MAARTAGAPAGVDTASWVFALLLLGVGIANLVLVHPVPALAYGLLALAYLPPVDAALRRRFGWGIHPLVKVALGILVVAFTLGVSDLGEMFDGPGTG